MYAGLSVAEIMSEKISDCCSAAVMNSNGIDEIANFHVDLFMKITYICWKNFAVSQRT